MSTPSPPQATRNFIELIIPDSVITIVGQIKRSLTSPGSPYITVEQGLKEVLGGEDRVDQRPHVTLASTDTENEDRILAALGAADLLRNPPTLTVVDTGHFTAKSQRTLWPLDRPLVFLTIDKSKELMAWQSVVCQTLLDAGLEVPKQALTDFAPHISVALGESGVYPPTDLEDALKTELATRKFPIPWSFTPERLVAQPVTTGIERIVVSFDDVPRPVDEDQPSNIAPKESEPKIGRKRHRRALEEAPDTSDSEIAPLDDSTTSKLRHQDISTRGEPELGPTRLPPSTSFDQL